MNDETRQKIKAANKGARMLQVTVAGTDTFVFKAPSRSEWDAWIDGDKSQNGMRVMAKSCCVYPDDADAAITKVLDQYPAVLGNGFADAIAELAGLGVAVQSPF